jgi:A/G-specific adenine glycosylase
VTQSETKRHIFSQVNSLLPKGKARVFNQALMDFGGLMCTPKAPQCDFCTIKTICKAFSRGVVAERPVLKAPPKTVLIHRLVAVIINNGKIYMQKRPSSAVWGGLWEFPGGEQVVEALSDSKINLVKEVTKETGLEITVGPYLVQVQHQYTHHKVSLDAYTCELMDRDSFTPDLANATAYRWMTPCEMDSSPCPSGVRKIIEHLKEIRPDIFI